MITSPADTSPADAARESGTAIETSATAADLTTWFSVLERNARENPDGVAIVDGARSVTNLLLFERVQHLIGGFRELGIGRGQIVSVWLPNCLEWVESAAALAALGATALGINTKLRSHDVAGLLKRAASSILITSPGFKGIDFLGMLREIHEADPDAVRLVVEVADPTSAELPEAPAGERAPSPSRHASPAARSAVEFPGGPGNMGFASVDYDELLEADRARPEHDDPHSPASAFTSSGSTGVPKIIMHTQAGLIGHSTAVARRFGYTDESCVVLAALPMCGVFGLNTLMAGLAAGRPVVMQAVFDARTTVEIIEQHRVTHSNLADAMLSMLLDAVDDESRIASLREVGFGNFTATDVRGIIERGRRMGKKFFQTYGSSEVQALMCYPPEDADVDRLSQGGGVPVSPLTEVRVSALDDGPSEGSASEVASAAAAPEPVHGEIEVRGPFVSPGRITENGYEDSPVDADGWFSTGDLGFMRTAEDVVYLNRMGDVLRLGGFLVSPREVEDFLIALSGIREAQFVAAPGPKGLVPIAFVILDQDSKFDETAAIDDCRAALAGFKVPKRIIPLPSFPTVRGANGDKIQRTKLREMAAEALGTP